MSKWRPFSTVRALFIPIPPTPHSPSTVVHHLSHSIADFGISKFLAAGGRGALFINATYRHPGHPDEPAFDWLTFPQLQQTLDFTLQDSVAFSDPAKVAVVFVFLSSESGNSVAMWRVKLKVPPDVLAVRGQAIEELKAALPAREKYVIFLEPWVLFFVVCRMID